jgi:predicted negative regulator of RcsB-dependent stress response
MSRKRLSKHQLKRDRFVEQTFDWAHWAETHRRQFLAGAAVLALAFGGFFVFQAMSRSAEEDASGAYMEARQAYFAGNFPLAASDLEDFVRLHGDTSFADDARFFRADALYQAGNNEAAGEALEEFLSRHGDSPFAQMARLLSATVYARLNRYEDAKAAYERAIEEAGFDVERARIHEELARLYVSRGDNADAAAQYRRIAELVPDTEVASRALRREAELSVEPLAVGGSAEDGS